MLNKLETIEKTESITKIIRRNPTARKIVQEIKVYIEKGHLEEKYENIRALYHEPKKQSSGKAKKTINHFFP